MIQKSSASNRQTNKHQLTLFKYLVKVLMYFFPNTNMGKIWESGSGKKINMIRFSSETTLGNLQGSKGIRQ